MLSERESKVIMRISSKPNELAQAEKIRKEHAPPPLPKTRPRRLSLPLSCPSKPSSISRISGLFKCHSEIPAVEQKTCQQKDSLLFSKLPPELRLTIWRMVLGDKLLHVMKGNQCLGTVQCPLGRSRDGPTPTNTPNDCWECSYCSVFFDFHFSWGCRIHKPKQMSLTAVLKTCRLM